MDGDTNTRQRLARNNRRRANKQNRSQNAENTIDSGQKKTQENRGKKQKKYSKLVPEFVLQNLPVPGPQHLAALDKLLNSVSADYGLSKEDLDLRWMVFNNVRELFEQKIKGCTLRLYGSSKSGLGLKTSDVNIDINEEDEEKVPVIFIAFLKLLQGYEQFTEIKEEFETKWPVINFKDVDSQTFGCTVPLFNKFKKL